MSSSHSWFMATPWDFQVMRHSEVAHLGYPAHGWVFDLSLKQLPLLPFFLMSLTIGYICLFPLPARKSHLLFVSSHLPLSKFHTALHALCNPIYIWKEIYEKLIGQGKGVSRLMESLARRENSHTFHYLSRCASPGPRRMVGGTDRQRLHHREVCSIIYG